MALNPGAKEPLPNIYALLSLAPLESNRDKIEHALAQLATLLESQSLQDPTAKKNAERILAFGRRHLLSAELKPIYDQRWRQTFGAANLPVDLGPTQPTSVWDMRELDKLLPTEDPNLPFDLAQFLQSSASRVPQDVEADFAKILSLLSAASETAQTTSSTASTKAEPRAATFVHKRKQRESSLLWMVVGALFCVGSVLAILFWRQNGEFKLGSSNSTSSDGLPNSNGTVQVQPSAEPRRSGLPQVQGLDANEPSQFDTMGEVTLALPEESPFSTVDPLTAGMPQVSQPELTNDIPVPASSPDNSTQLGPPSNQPNMNQHSTTLTETQKQDWLTTLGRIKTLIGNQDYAAAEQEITAARANAKTSEQSTQILQLSTVRQLSQELSQAMRQAAAGMGVGEVFTIGTSTPVSLVEVTDDRLIVRMRGQNLSFLFSEVPIGLAFALADLKMDADDPTSKARKAAFTLAHPGAAGNDLAQQRARSLMAEAIAAGVVPDHLMQAFGD